MSLTNQRYMGMLRATMTSHTWKECVGRHAYLILSGVLLGVACLTYATIDGMTPTVIAFILVFSALCIGGKLAYRKWSPQVIFHLFMGGYVIFRLPGLVYHQDTFFVFCEARKGIQDSNHADLVMRKGQLRGSKVKWGDLRLIAHEDGYRCANPVPIIDRETNTLMVVFILLVPGACCRDFIDKNYEQKVQVVKSTDWGETWIREDITESIIGANGAAFFATGPCHGIQLKSGRLIIPGKFNLKADPNQKACRNGTCDHSTVIFSDDYGKTWRLGGYVPYREDHLGRAIHTCEATIVELKENVLCMNSRTLHPEHPRAQSFSYDAGMKFDPPELPDNLIEQAYNECGYVSPERGGAPGCQGSILGLPAPKIKSSSFAAPLLETHPVWVLFTNPATRYGRFKMSVRLSRDGCQTWSKPWTIWRLASGYSDMTLVSDKHWEQAESECIDGSQLKIGVAFESGLFFFWETVVFKMFDVNEVRRKTEAWF